MTRRTLYTALAGLAVTLIVSQTASAQEAYGPGQYGGAGGFYGGPGISAPVMNAGLYPMPVQTVPPRIGGTYITNPAFYPHEYLYAHEHHYLAPPFYYAPGGKFHFLKKLKHHGDDCCDDECVEACPRCGSSHCNGHCKIRGTEVTVKYKRKRCLLFTKFLPPH